MDGKLMTEWFRSWHGAPTDPKWRVVAKRASVRPGDVWAVISYLWDRASQSDDRGSVEGFDPELMAEVFGYETEEVERIIAALRDKNVLSGNRIAAWEKYQPKREDNASERAKAWRERNRTQPNADERPDTEEDTEPPLTPLTGGDDAVFDETWETFPRNPQSVKAKARRAFDKLEPPDKLDLRAKAKRYRDWWAADCRRRKEPEEARLSFVPSLATWIGSGAWREADSLPGGESAQGPPIAMVKLDRDRDGELWLACERIMGKAAPTDGFEWAFKAEIVEQARAARAA